MLRAWEPVYRDALPTMIERWRHLDAEVREKLAQVEARGWRYLPEETRERVESLRLQGARESRLWDDALVAIDALERCREALDAALAALDDPHGPWNIPSPDWPRVYYPWMRTLDPWLAGLSSAELSEDDEQSLAQRVGDIARRFDEGATLERMHQRGARARFRAGGAPVVFDAWSVQGGGFWSGARVEVGLLTTARRSAPRLVLRPESSAGGFGRSGRGAATGHADFDARFVWEGEPGATAVLQRREVQRGLLEVCIDDVPTLMLDEGMASLRWTFGPTVRSVTAAVTVLRLLRGGG